MERSRRPTSAGRRVTISITPPSGGSDSSIASKEANTAATAIQCRKRVLDRWELLKQQAQARRALLEESHQFQVFKRDDRDALAWIDDKMSFAADESYRDPTNLQAKLHKQQAFEAELAARQSEQNKLLAMGNELIDAGHYKADEIEQALLKLDQTWQDLQEKTAERRRKLEEAQHLLTALQKFIGDFRDVMSWMKEMCNQMASAELAKDLPGAEDLLKIHQELKSEILARENVTKEIHQFGQNLVLTEHYAKDDIVKDLKGLEAQKDQMDNTWETRKIEFQQCLELQQFERDARVAEKWTAARDTFLQASEEDLGDSLDSVEALQKKHDSFEKSLAAQEENIKALVEFADKLVAEGHYAVTEIESIRDMAIENREMLKQSAEERRQMLQQSYEKQCFDRDTNEAEMWIAEQMLIASDESYRDPTNLQGKIQKQQAFEAEIAANRSQVDNVIQTAIRLNDSGHFAAEHITGRVEQLSELWDSLCEAARVKTERLGEAWKAQQLNRAIEDVMVWIETTASSLVSEEHGRDLASVNALLKRHQLIEHSISAYRERVEALRQEGQLLVEQGHFSADEIKQTCLTLVERYEGLTEPAATRRQLLRSSLQLHQYLREIDGLEAWVVEREPLAESTEYGTDLTGAQRLHKKHQTFSAELAGHQQRILGLGSTARSLYEDGHMSSDLIMDKWQVLEQRWNKLRGLSHTRSQKLDQSLQSQSYYADVTEAESWLNDKQALVQSGDLGKDEDSTQNLIKRLASAETALDVFERDTLSQLQVQATGMIAKAHFDADSMSKRQQALEDKTTSVHQLMKIKRQDLDFQLELHRFTREADTVEAWIAEQMATASLEDLGSDVEHCQRLKEKFEAFSQTLVAGEERVTSSISAGDKLLATKASTLVGDALSSCGISDIEASELIERRQQQLADNWNELQSLVTERSEQLEGALEIHLFNRMYDEVTSRIGEKEKLITSDDVGKDVASAESLQRQHEGFERDLAALEGRVEDIRLSASTLSNTFSENAEGIADQESEVVGAWERLTERCASRKQQLQESLQLQRFLSDVKDLVSWMRNVHSLVGTNEPIKDVASAEAALKLHYDHKAEIDARASRLKGVVMFGQNLVQHGHPSANQVKEKLDALESEKMELQLFWGERKNILQWTLDLEQFERDANIADGWMTSREALLATEDIGENMENIDDLLQQHMDFEKALHAQEDKMKTLDEHANKLVDGQLGWVN